MPELGAFRRFRAAPVAVLRPLALKIARPCLREDSKSPIARDIATMPSSRIANCVCKNFASGGFRFGARYHQATPGGNRLPDCRDGVGLGDGARDRKSTRLNSSHLGISYAVFC